jgi:hypothetical protein
MTSFGKGILNFLDTLNSRVRELTEGISVYNPYAESAEAHRCVVEFYDKFFNDQFRRNVFFGTNPFRWGAGLTGVPFTDARRLAEKCGINFNSPSSQENASAFIYDVVNEFGGPAKFYRQYYFNWLCPIGFLNVKMPHNNGFPYYQEAALYNAIKALIVKNIQHLLEIGTKRDYCFCIGLGKNEYYLRKINDQYGFFSKIVALEHPGYITRYHSSERGKYLNHYIKQISDAEDRIK